MKSHKFIPILQAQIQDYCAFALSFLCCIIHLISNIVYVSCFFHSENFVSNDPGNGKMLTLFLMFLGSFQALPFLPAPALGCIGRFKACSLYICIKHIVYI